MPRSYLPPVVTDSSVLSARLDQILSHDGKSDSTLSSYRSALRWWEGFCADYGVEPWDAPFDTWEAAIQIGRRVDGKRLGWDYYSLIERAVAREHHERKLPLPAPRRPEHAGAWSDIGKSYRARLNLAWSKDREQYDRAPLDREDINALLGVDILDLPATSTAGHAGRDAGMRRVAERLVLLDTECSANLLAKASRDQVRLSVDGVSILVGDDQHYLRHDPGQRLAGVPWDCAHCAVVERLAETRGTERLFDPRAVRQVADGRWPGLVRSTSRLIERPGLTVRERAGLRRGLVLSAHRPKEWTWWLLARAWVAVSWEAGLRMAGDLAGLDRSWCSPLPAGDGFRIKLHRTKDDQSGDKSVTRPFRLDPDGGPAQR